jgi:hypothetical protein
VLNEANCGRHCFLCVCVCLKKLNCEFGPSSSFACLRYLKLENKRRSLMIEIPLILSFFNLVELGCHLFLNQALIKLIEHPPNPFEVQG